MNKDRRRKVKRIKQEIEDLNQISSSLSLNDFRNRAFQILDDLCKIIDEEEEAAKKCVGYKAKFERNLNVLKNQATSLHSKTEKGNTSKIIPIQNGLDIL